MRQIELGRTGIKVSEWCLGTMTYGNQTSQADAHAQMDRALAAGVNFWDTAEMYPVNPVRAETVGRSEEIIGNWFAATGRRAEVVIATKVAGPNPNFVRGGKGFDGPTIHQAVDASLRRLQTDVIDLYQLHWPERGSYMFRQNWTYDPSGQDNAATLAHMDEVLGAMAEVVKAGKVRAFGLSNESCWGTTRWIDRAAMAGAPRVATVQNEYSLMCRLYDTDMAEMAVNEGVTLLAFSPLACGLLTGKYQNGAVPLGSRMTLNGDLSGRKGPRAFAAVDGYLDLAATHGLDPVHMALAWHRTRPFVSCPIFGATSVAQLDKILAGAGVVLGAELVTAINLLHRGHPMPY
jgi:aryl-alcohol dehydrogenase-like predicted oxidoreductase